jgi:hypothetical protein
MAMRKATMGTVLAIAVMGIVASVLGSGIYVTHKVPNSGTITVVTPPPSPPPSPPPPTPSAQLGLYSDSSCTAALSSVTWGTLNPGDTATVTIYLRNEGNVALALSISAGNWTPSGAQNYFTFSWNRDGYVMQPSDVISAVLTLQVSSSISGITSFNFDITITATQQ